MARRRTGGPPAPYARCGGEAGFAGPQAARGPGRQVPAPGLGDERGIAAAYTAHGAEIYRFALRGLGDPGAAQDVVQEAFLRAWRYADRHDPALSGLRVWLFAIARNVMVDQLRAAAARQCSS